MIETTSTLSMLHHACAGVHAPRDKYTLEAMFVLGKFTVTINEDLSADFVFDADFDGYEKPTENNIRQAEQSLGFYIKRDKEFSVMSSVMMQRRMRSRELYGDAEDAPTYILSTEDVIHALDFTYKTECDLKGSLSLGARYVVALQEAPEKVLHYLYNTEEGNRIYG